MAAQTASPAKFRVPAGFVLLVSSFVAVGPLTIDLYLPAFPQIQSALSTTDARVQLTLTATLLGLALGQLLIGSVSDAYGRRRPLVAAMTVYVVVSVAIAASSTIELFTALRFVQGFAASAGLVLAIAIVRDSYSGVAMGKIIARLMLIVGIAPILAPVLGSQLMLFLPWRALFVVLALFGAGLLALVLFVLPETLPPDRRRTGGTRAALASYASLVAHREFALLALLTGFYFSALFTYIAASPYVFQDQFGLSPQQFGMAFGAGALSVTVFSQVNGILLGRVSPERILQLAIGAGFLGSVALFVAAARGAGFWAVLTLVLVVLGTCGFVFPSAPAVALARNAHQAGTASALLGAAQFGIGAAVAPATAFLGQDATALGAVMVVVTGIAAVLVFVVSRRWRRTGELPSAYVETTDVIETPPREAATLG